MSTITINYNALEKSIIKSREARSKIEEYMNTLTRRVTNPIAAFPGNDNYGYASTASSLAWQKINTLNEELNHFTSYEVTLSNFASNAKHKDQSTANSMNTITSAYVGKRSVFQQVGDFLYNTFCVDLVNDSDLLRTFSNCAETVNNKIGDKLESIYNYFKYGDGQYIWNIATTVVGVVAAVGGAIAAIAAIPALPAVATVASMIPVILGVTGAIATTIGACITFANGYASIVQNAKAEKLRREGEIGAARYYGDIDKLSDYYKKTDMGSASENKSWERAGQVIDTTKVAADTVTFATNVLSLGNVKDYSLDDNPVTGYSLTYDNIKKNILHDMGFKLSDGKVERTGDSLNPFKNLFESSYVKKIENGVPNLSGWVKESLPVFRFFKATDNMISVVEDTVGIAEFANRPSLSSTGDLAENVTGLLGNFDLFKPIDKYVTKLFSLADDIIPTSSSDSDLSISYSGGGSW